MAVDTPFMPWLDHLAELGDPLRRDRAELLAIAQQAIDLERRALALRARLAVGQSALLQRVMKHWTLADIQAASDAAGRADPLAAVRDQVDDAALRGCVRALDGWHLAAEALQAFDQAGVIRQHNLLSTATDDERRQTLARVLAWWNHVGRPVCERLAVK